MSQNWDDDGPRRATARERIEQVRGHPWFWRFVVVIGLAVAALALAYNYSPTARERLDATGTKIEHGYDAAKCKLTPAAPGCEKPDQK